MFQYNSILPGCTGMAHMYTCICQMSDSVNEPGDIWKVKGRQPVTYMPMYLLCSCALLACNEVDMT